MNYEFVEILSDRQVKDLKELYEKEWWTTGREVQEIKKMLAHSDVVVGISCTETGELIGFARVLTDFTYKALIFDVIVKDAYRTRSLGRALMARIIDHPRSEKVRHFELYCRPEIRQFYQKWGFTEELGELYFMRKNNG